MKLSKKVEYHLTLDQEEFDSLRYYLIDSVSMDLTNPLSASNHAIPGWGPLAEKAHAMRVRLIEEMNEVG